MAVYWNNNANLALLVDCGANVEFIRGLSTERTVDNFGQRRSGMPADMQKSKEILSQPVDSETVIKLLSCCTYNKHPDHHEENLAASVTNTILKPRILAIFASTDDLYAHDLQEQHPRLLSKLMHLSTSPSCLPQGCYQKEETRRDNYQVILSTKIGITWLEATQVPREQIARDWVWGRRRAFALFWHGIGGPFAVTCTTGTSMRRATTLVAAAAPPVEVDVDSSFEAQVEEVDDEAAEAAEAAAAARTAFIKDPANQAFLGSSMARVLYMPNTRFRSIIASYL